MTTSNTNFSQAYLQLKNDLTRPLVGGYALASPSAAHPLARGNYNRVKQGPDGVWVGIYQTSGRR